MLDLVVQEVTASRNCLQHEGSTLQITPQHNVPLISQACPRSTLPNNQTFTQYTLTGNIYMPQYYDNRTTCYTARSRITMTVCCVCSPDNQPPFKTNQRTGTCNKLINYKVGTVGSFYMPARYAQ